MKQTFLMLAKKYKDQRINGWYYSEKLDGVRCFWDGGLSRGNPKSCFSWANTAKDNRYVNIPLCTGLWTRYGHPIQAPDWFLDTLPVGVCLDGELWAGKDTFQQVVGTVKKLIPCDTAWSAIKYKVFDAPGNVVLMDRDIVTSNYKCKIREGILACNYIFSQRLKMIPDELKVQHNKLPLMTNKVDSVLSTAMRKICEAGGEGLMLRNPVGYYDTFRSENLLKMKKLEDAEGIVMSVNTAKPVGEARISGKISDSKIKGMMGSLTIKMLDSNILFDLGTGFTEAERQWWMDTSNPVGRIIKFQYASLTRDGLPKEARYYARY